MPCPADNQRKKVGVRMRRRWEDLGKNIKCRQGCLVRHQGQVNQLLDRAANCSRSSREVIKATPRLKWLTISKIVSSRCSGEVCAVSRRPIRRWVSVRKFSGINE